MKLSPILVSVYNRKETFLETIEALGKNYLAEKSILYIVSDAPFKEEHQEGIEEIRNIIENIKGFKEVKKIFREINLGAQDSVNSAIEFVLKEHGKVIFLEDDIVTSKYFLKYMNESLEIFKNDENIFGICGFNPPDFLLPKEYNEDIYMWGYYNPWGIGIWQEKWMGIDWELKGFEDFYKNKKQVLKFFRGENHSFLNLMAVKKGHAKAADAIIEWNIFMNNQNCIFPKYSLTKNIGLIGEGVHSTSLENISKEIQELVFQELKEFNPKVRKGICKNKVIEKMKAKYYSRSLYRKISGYLFVFGFYNILRNIKRKIFLKV